MEASSDLTSTSQIKNWRSIVTLIVFVLTNVNVLFPFHIPIYIPRRISDLFSDALGALRIIPSGQYRYSLDPNDDQNGKIKSFVRLNFPMNFVTAPLIADLFLLAILAIGRKEVHDGIIGSDNISPIDIMAFFITLAYIAISIDASGLIRYLAFKVLQLGGKVGHRLFFSLYVFFFILGSFIGNDPIILSGTAFLAYMTRVSSNIIHPRAWIHTQFAIANIASAILVSSNPTNLVLAGAFRIKFINYTANMIVPVVVTAIVLFPFLLYIVFADESLIPYSIEMHDLPEEVRRRKPVNPNIPHARGHVDDEDDDPAEDRNKLLPLEEILNPFLDKGGAAFGAAIMATTLVTVLALNAASTKIGEHPVFWVTLPGAFVMFCWDIGFGWYHRKETREIARKGRQEFEASKLEKAIRQIEESGQQQAGVPRDGKDTAGQAFMSSPMRLKEAHQRPAEAASTKSTTSAAAANHEDDDACNSKDKEIAHSTNQADVQPPFPAIMVSENTDDRVLAMVSSHESASSLRAPTKPNGDALDRDGTFASENTCLDENKPWEAGASSGSTPLGTFVPAPIQGLDAKRRDSYLSLTKRDRGPTTLSSVVQDLFRWLQETFPTATAVATHLPFALVPFAFCMFILVQGLVTKGWVSVFAYGWDHWVHKTGTVGAVGGMAFLSVVLCNFAGTNIGTTILLSRVIQSWLAIREKEGVPVSERNFWATVYSMALGVNYGAFSAALSASLAGLLWRDILGRKHIHVRSLEFAHVNLPIISIAMMVGCSVLVGEVYLVRSEKPYVAS